MGCRQKVNHLVDSIRSGRLLRPSLGGAAEIVGYSPFHFQRLFKKQVGETLQSFSTRVRLARAAQILRGAGSGKILEIGLECGFESAEDFSRSFRRCYGVTPRDACRGATLGWNLSQVAVRPVHPIGSLRKWSLRKWPVRLQRLPEMHIIYSRVFQASQSPSQVISALKQLYDWSGLSLVGLGWDDPEITPMEYYCYDAGVVVDRLPMVWEDWMNYRYIPSRLYAVADFQGDALEEAEAFAYIKSVWLPSEGYAVMPETKLEFFLDERSLCDWNRLNLKICVPVIQRNSSPRVGI